MQTVPEQCHNVYVITESLLNSKIHQQHFTLHNGSLDKKKITPFLTPDLTPELTTDLPGNQFYQVTQCMFCDFRKREGTAALFYTVYMYSRSQKNTAASIVGRLVLLGNELLCVA